MAQLAATRWYLRLQAGLAFYLGIHLLALVTMGLLLRGALDPAVPALERAQAVAEHAWRIRLGWLPWQLCALSDLLCSYFLLRYLLARRALGPGRGSGGAAWAALGLLLTLVAAVPEQWAEAMWVSRHIALAQEVVAGQAEVARWAEASVAYDLVTGVWGNSFYVLATACWMIATRRATRSRIGAAPGWLELALLGLFLSAGAFLGLRSLATSPVTEALFFGISGLFNGLAFPALLVWGLAWAHRLGAVQREGLAAREARAADPPLRWPRLSRIGAIAASPGLRDLIRALFSPLPFPELHSDLGPVLYLSWLVPTERAAAYLPAPLVPHDLDGMTAVTVLSYRHGHFGPRFLGPLRRVLPSPIQSNWRLYLPPPDGAEGIKGQHAVAFLINAMDSALYSLGARLGSDGLPVHLVRGAQYTLARERDTLPEPSEAEGAAGGALGTEIGVELDPGEGSGPDLRCRARGVAEGRLPPAFKERFESYEEAVTYLVRQGRAARVLPGLGALSESFIGLDDIDLAKIQPYELAEPIQSDWLHDLIEGADCLAFVAPPFCFRTLGERLIPLASDTPKGGSRDPEGDPS